MEGNFDFPPASDQSSPIGNLTARFDARLRTFANTVTNAQNNERATDSPTTDPSASSSASTVRPGLPIPPGMPRRRRRTGSGTQSGSRRSSGPRDDWYRVESGRPRLERPSIRRFRADMQSNTALLREEIRQRQEQLERVESHVTGVEATLGLSRNAGNDRDAPTEEPGISGDQTQFGTHAMELLSANRRLNKRRKLEHERDENLGFPGFSYGHEGQVVPGLLKMEIVGCDGGEYSSHSLVSPSMRAEIGAMGRTDVGRSENYRAENVLRDDRSVYCTKSKRCNLMLRHRGEALFHLERVVIKAPELGYTAPLQQGLVFVGMESAKLSAGTSTYHIAYDNPNNSSYINASSIPDPVPNPGVPRRHPAPDSERLPLLEALHDPVIWEASRQQSNRARNATLPRPPGMRRNPVDTLLAILGDDEEAISAHRDAYGEFCDWPEQDSTRGDQTQADFVTSDADSGQGGSGSGHSELTTAPTPPPFTVTWESEEDDDDIDDVAYPSNRRLPPPHRRETSSSDDETSDALARLYYGGAGRRPTRRSSPGRIELRDGAGEVKSTESDANRGFEIIKPHARFFIGEKRSKITIRFDPPVSGRFLLLKLFSPELHDGENIDIQYVAAYGFAGPRFFPSVEMK